LEQPEYYNLLEDVAGRAARPALGIWVAIGEAGEPLGSVDFIEDLRHYGSGGTASEIPNAAGIRLLAVRPDCRGGGVGKALTRFCIERARELGKEIVVLHTTRAMETAWAMYERLGFKRLPGIDFRQGDLEVFGFQLSVKAPVKRE
jgi:ribosomal protein S18 acetylase RimI-like enzyme